MLFFQGDYAKAAPHLRTVVKLRPDLAKIQALLGMSERRLGQAAAAEADLEKAFPQLQEEKLRVQAGGAPAVGLSFHLPCPAEALQIATRNRNHTWVRQNAASQTPARGLVFS